MSSNEHLTERIFVLENDVEELRREIAILKELIPKNLSKKLKEVEEKLEGMQDTIDGLDNA